MSLKTIKEEIETLTVQIFDGHYYEMEKLLKFSWTLSGRILMGVLLLAFRLAVSEAYDTMDPYGNITIRWDVMEWHDDRYTAVVTIYNYQLYRHIDPPGWRYEWEWPGEEVIWNMWGAEVTEQGNCSKYQAPNIPHSCEKKPVVVDFLPGVPYNQQVKNCCKAGILSTMTQDPTSYAASFQLDVGTLPAVNSSSDDDFFLPQNHSLGLPGYSCSPAFLVPATRFTSDGRRFTLAVKTWNVTCTYSQYLASPALKCCVSMSSFYNNTIVQCPICSCGCRGAPPTGDCVEDEHFPSLIRMPNKNDVMKPSLLCTNHMCPIRVHWHVKLSYRNYWRVKVTISNFHFLKNYSDWNLVIQHPNLQSVNQVFSFNYRPLNQYGSNNDTGMFWGVKYYNDMLLQAGELGNVQTEILLKKDPGLFTFSEGWAFPRKISFNGDECVMPLPDDFPRLPNASPKQRCDELMFSIFILLMLLL